MNMCDKLPLYLYNEIDTDEKQKFEEHLKSCKDCREFQNTFNAVQNTKQPQSLPKSAIDNIFEATTRKNKLAFWTFKRKMQFGLAMAAGILIAVLVFPREKEVKYVYQPVIVQEQIVIASADGYDYFYELDELETELLEFEKEFWA